MKTTCPGIDARPEAPQATWRRALALAASLGLFGCEAPPDAPSAPLAPPVTAAPSPEAPGEAPNVGIALVSGRLVVGLDRNLASRLGDDLLLGPSAAAVIGGSPIGDSHARLVATVEAAGGRIVYLEPSAGIAWIETRRGRDLDAVARELLASGLVTSVRRDPLARGADADAVPMKGKPTDPGPPEGKGKPPAKGKPDPDGAAIASSGGTVAGPLPWYRDALGLTDVRTPDVLGRPVVVAILDTGLTLGPNGAPAAPALSHVPVLPGVDFVNLDDDPSDDNGHGTLMASLLAAEGAFPGVAPDVSILPIKVLDEARVGSEAALAAGLRHAVAAGVDVISMSLAFPEGFIPSAELASAVASAREAGIVVLGAAGNHGANEIAYPAAFGSVVAVGSGRLAKAHKHDGSPAGHKLRRASYSGYGGALDVVGPGGSLAHDLNKDGYADGIPAMGPAPDGSHAWYLVTGTSAATAQVAGVVARMLGAGAEPADVPALLQIGAAHLPTEGFDTVHGAGAVNAGRSVRLAAKGQAGEAPTLYVNPVLTLVEDGAGRRRAVALVEVVDEALVLAPGVTVLGHFRGESRHDVIGTTDASGRVLFASLPADAGTLWEFGVDAVLDGGADAETASAPVGFARFERMSFRALASFSASGAGFEPSPFILGVDAEALMPLVEQRAVTTPRGSDLWLTGVVLPVSTIPEDLESWTPVPSLIARSFAVAGDRGPTAVVFDRVLMSESCAFADRWVPVVSRGAGFEPSPFILDGSYLAIPPGADQVIVRGEGSLFLNGVPTTPDDLGLLLGVPGVVVVGESGSTCPPNQHLVTDLGVFPETVRNGTGTASWGGFSLSVVADGDDPGFAAFAAAWADAQEDAQSGSTPLGQTLLGAAWGLSPLSTGAMATVLASDASDAIVRTGLSPGLP